MRRQNPKLCFDGPERYLKLYSSATFLVTFAHNKHKYKKPTCTLNLKKINLTITAATFIMIASRSLKTSPSTENTQEKIANPQVLPATTAAKAVQQDERSWHHFSSSKTTTAIHAGLCPDSFYARPW